MKAHIWERYGSAQFMRMAEIEEPEPKAGEIKIRVIASSVNSWDWENIEGGPLTRTFSPIKPAHPVLGADMSGEVVALGAGVTAFALGDRVFGDLSDDGWGGFAQYATGPAHRFGKIPEGLSFEDAACIPQAGTLALQAIEAYPNLGPSHRVLVIGGGGGLGAYALQLARQAGAHVVGSDLAVKGAFMRQMGAHETWIAGDEPEPSMAGKFDLVIDPVAREPIKSAALRLAENGKYVVIGGSVGGLLRVAGNMLMRKFVDRPDVSLLVWKSNVGQSITLGEKVARGDLLSPLFRGFELERANEAIQLLADRKVLGKVVVLPQEVVKR